MYDGTPRPPFSSFSSPLSVPSPRRRRPLRAAALGTALFAVLLSGCGKGEQDSSSNTGARSAKGFPVSIDNCDTRITYKEPPSRVVTIHQHPTELLLKLGLKEKIVGTAFPDSAVLPELAKEYAAIPQLSKKEPSFESVLDKEPDLVYGGYASAFAEKDGRSRKAFANAGVNTYLNREYCERERVSMRDAYDEIRTIGRIFGVPERADALAADLEGRVARTTGAVKGARTVPVFVYDSGDKSAFTAGGKSLGTEIIKLAGGRNVFADLDEVFGDASWEQVVARKPEVIVIYDYEGAGSVERKKEFLLSQPALADVPAVKNKRFAVLPLTATLVGVRPPYAVQELARGLHPERFR